MSDLIVNKPGYLSDASIQFDNSDLSQFTKPPRVKIIQATTGAPYKPQFKDGDVVLVPNLTKLADVENPVTFVPIHFFPTWICLNPIQMKGTLKTIRDFSFDPLSEVAKKAKTFVKERCPENTEYYLQYNETFNFIVVFEDIPELVESPVHIFFSRGEYQTGQKLIGKIQERRAPRYACRFRLATSMHVGKKGQWYGCDILNDSSPWVSEENFFKYQKLYEELKKLVDSRSLELDTEELPAGNETSEF